MGRVTFKYSDDKTFDRYHYQSDSVGDMSGDYYPSAEVERLVEAALSIELNWETICWGYNPKFCDKLKAALAPFVEESEESHE